MIILPSPAYITFANIMRYFFVLAMLYILIRITIQSVREYISIRKAQYWVDGVYAATVKFIAPAEFEEAAFELEKKNIIGSSKRCDLYINGCDLEKKHAAVIQKKHGAFIEAYGILKLNGEELEKGDIQPLHDGDKVELGEVAFIFKTRLKEENNA